MAKFKPEEIIKMSKEERKEKMEELKIELVKSRVNAAKTGGSKIREIKKMIARLLTLDRNK